MGKASRVAVLCPHDPAHPGFELARRLGLPVLSTPPSGDCELVLQFDAGGRLGVRPAGAPARAAVAVDFEVVRARLSGARRAPLARAVLGSRRTPLRVLDAHAGLGRDTFTLAALGCDVVAVERDPIVWALLEDGLRRARADDLLAPSAQRIDLRRAEAAEVLEETEGRFDAVLLDPMVGPAGRSALPKKDLQVLARLLGSGSQEAEAAELLERARERAPRVVVKRPRRAPPIAPGRRAAIRSKRVRFDVYGGEIRPARTP